MATRNSICDPFLAMVVWRFVLAGPTPLAFGSSNCSRQHRRRHHLEGSSTAPTGRWAVIAGNRFENSSDESRPIDRKQLRQSYLPPRRRSHRRSRMGDGVRSRCFWHTQIPCANGYIRRFESGRSQKRIRRNVILSVQWTWPKAAEIATALFPRSEQSACLTSGRSERAGVKGGRPSIQPE